MRDPRVAAAVTILVLGFAAAVGGTLWFIFTTVSFDLWRSRRRQRKIKAARCDIEQRKAQGEA